jgi:hypothetical protein
MIVSLIFLLLLFAIVVVQSTQGMFSALIMTVLTLCCAALAFGTHEWVAHTLMAKYWKPDFAHPVTLAALFGIPLIVLRIVFDKVIRRDCLVPTLVGRVGGGLCGLVTGYVITGVAAVCLQMVPFGASIFGFTRFASGAVRTDSSAPNAQPPKVNAPDSGLWLSPDKVAAGLATLMADGVFSGGASFSRTYPDFVQAVAWDSFVHAEVSRYTPPDGISVVHTEPVSFVYRLVPGDRNQNKPDGYESLGPEGGETFWMIRVQLKDAARDKRKSHIFSLRQFRLVGLVGDVERQFFPIAVQQADASQSVNRHIRFVRDGRGDWPVVDDLYQPRAGNNEQVEIVFSLTSGFEPRFLEYKRGSRTPVRFSSGAESRRGRLPGDPEEPPPAAPPPIPPEPEPVAESKESAARPERRRRPDEPSTPPTRARTHRFATLEGQSVFGDQLPMELRSYRSVRNLEASGGRLRGGHLLAEIAEQEAGTAETIKTFEVPPDKRLLHLNVEALGARSGLGRAISFARGVVQNYVVEDANGRQYKVVGKYAVANVQGRELLEIQYFPDQVGTVGGLGPFSRIDEDNLKQDEHLVLLFLVEPGAEIRAFSTGGSAREDIRTQMLVAPN